MNRSVWINWNGAVHCFNLTTHALKNVGQLNVVHVGQLNIVHVCQFNVVHVGQLNVVHVGQFTSLFMLVGSTLFKLVSSTLFMLASSNVVHAIQLNVVHGGQLMVAMSSTFFKPCNKPRPWSCCSFLHNQNKKINYFDLDICIPSPKMQNSIHKCIALSTFAYPSILTSYYTLIFLQLAHI